MIESIMDVQKVLCMQGGTGETSYANNSRFQKGNIDKLVPILEESVKALCLTISPECLNIADFGCASGPNALIVLQSIIDVAISTCQSSGHQIPEFNAFMNDLPQNDFNNFFKLWPGFYNGLKNDKGDGVVCCISGTPGSFYGRLFPTNLLHFVHSSYSLHWLSQVPNGLVGADGKEVLNKGSIYATKNSSLEVLKAYQNQFGRDFTNFLASRSKEIVEGGRLVLSFIGTLDDEPFPVLDSISKALNQLASKGDIDENILDEFNLPTYRPTIEQVKQLIESEGSFRIHMVDTYSLGEVVIRNDIPQLDIEKRANAIVNAIRGAIQPLLASEFGEEMMDQLFDLAEHKLMDILTTDQDMDVLNHVVSLSKKKLLRSTKMN